MKTIVLFGIVGLFFLYSCHSKPEVIKPANSQLSASHPELEIQDPKTQVHEVEIEEVLHGTKYTYLNVLEDESLFWIAIPRSEVEKGVTYYYQGGLLMKNFESVEFDRVFETIYLVSGISEQSLPTSDQSLSQVLDQSKKLGAAEIKQAGIGNLQDGVTLKEIFDNPKKYEGKVVKVKGQCVKVNRNIMDRNWVHIQDGTEQDATLNLTITTDDFVNVGEVVVFEGKISLNVDFGAGYRYEIIMQEAVLVM